MKTMLVVLALTLSVVLIPTAAAHECDTPPPIPGGRPLTWCIVYCVPHSLMGLVGDDTADACGLN